MTHYRFEKQSARRSFLATIGGILAGSVVVGGGNPLKAQAKTEKSTVPGKGIRPFDFGSPAVGEIIMFAGNFAPTNWALCDGSAISRTTYSTLYGVIGTTFGVGDGSTTFNLPNLCSRMPIGTGQGTGFTNRNLGDTGGEESHALTTGEIPAHTHSIGANTGSGTSNTPVGHYPAANEEGYKHYSSSANTTMNAAALATAGTGQAHNNIQPYVAVNFIICISGNSPYS